MLVQPILWTYGVFSIRHPWLLMLRPSTNFLTYYFVWFKFLIHVLFCDVIVNVGLD